MTLWASGICLNCVILNCDAVRFCDSDWVCVGNSKVFCAFLSFVCRSVLCILLYDF